MGFDSVQVIYPDLNGLEGDAIYDMEIFEK